MIHPTAHIYDSAVTVPGDVTIRPGAVIGFGGFEFHGGEYQEHEGAVVIGYDVYIGANTTIDRGLGPHDITKIGDNTKISNQVQIGHNAQIGKDCIICGHAQIARCVIGDNVTICPSACIKGGVTIGDGAYIGLGSVVVKDVPAGMLVYGNPAKEHGKARKK